MRAALSFLRSRWFLSFIGVALLSVLVWLFGPFLSALESPWPRAAIILAFLLIWLAVNLWLDARRRRADKALIEGATATQADPTAAASAEEVAAMREKLTAALTLLKKHSNSRGYLYEQPWYAIIGPPGAGKTTALLNAGLKFPLAAELGQSPVAGVGGTRMCDWWFTEDAVLIDTAGRYTTQDSDAAVDKAGWTAFLGLLKRTRARQPLNGLIVAISITDLAAGSPAERLGHARAIRRRIKEVYDQLGLRIPVYALFTKADLIAGFTEFFDNLDRERRGQVWGTTFPFSTNETGPVGNFAAEFQLLIERLNLRLLERLQTERSPERRTLIAGFPAQIASLQAPIMEFLTEAFGGSRLDPAQMLRGVYVTSGTQEGTPIDRLTGVLSRAFGIDQQRAPSLRPEQGRSYFLGRLMKEVIFGEAMLVARDPASIRRNLLLRSGVIAIALLVVVLGVSALWQTRQANQSAVAQSEAGFAQYQRTAGGLPLDPVKDADFAQIAPLLDQARALPFGKTSPQPVAQWFPGLSQTGKLGAAANVVYQHALENVLLPRLVVRVETQMRQNFDNPAFLYEATRIYLMLGSQGPLDRASVKEWFHYDWQNQYPGPAAQPLRTSLETHLAALLDQPLSPVPLDGALVEDARRTFSRIPLAQRVYSSIRRSPEAQDLPPWVPAQALGTGGARLFTRASGKPLTDGIPGFYTLDGFWKVLLPSLPTATKQVATESWVLGKQSEINPNSPQVLSLQNDVIALYVADYEKQWDEMIADLQLAPLGGAQEAVNALYILSSPQSPMKDLLSGMARQVTLSQPPTPPTPPGAQSVAQAAAGAVASAAAAPAARLQSLLGQNAANTAPPGKAVDDHFAALRNYVGSGQNAPIDGTLHALNALQQQLAQVASMAPGGAGGAPAVASGPDAAQMVQAEASQDPAPVNRWLAGLTSGANVIRGGGAKQQAAAAFGGPGGPASLCHKAVDGRYPFVAGASNEIPLADFGRLFAPNGLLDTFFNTQLRPFVDTAGPVWKAQAVQGVAPPVGPGALAEFQRAAAIRDLFFAGGGNQPSVGFTLTPVSLDDGAKQVTLELGGQTLSYAHGPLRPTAVTWPGSPPMINARLVFDPAPPDSTGVLQASGPWALFRLFDMGRLSQGGSSERYTLTFNVGDRHAEFEVRAASVLNPFDPAMLRAFRCPGL